MAEGRQGDSSVGPSLVAVPGQGWRWTNEPTKRCDARRVFSPAPSPLSPSFTPGPEPGRYGPLRAAGACCRCANPRAGPLDRALVPRRPVA